MTKYGYARVSTAAQDLSIQLEQLDDYACDFIYKDVFSGTNKDRPQLDALRTVLKDGDVIVVTKLDRLARSTSDALNLIEEFRGANVDLVVLDLAGQTIDTSTPMGKLFLTVVLGFAEFERALIVQRTSEGKEYQRKHNPNYKDGRPHKYTKAQMDHAMYLLDYNSYKDVETMTGISKATLTRHARKRNVRKMDR